jgi:ParB family chromosome partitioning protein
MEQFQILPIEKVFESPLNPRKHFNEKKMEELVESIRDVGVLVPLIVRPCKDSKIAPLDRFEIAAGHRRYRAAIQAELKEVPLIIREMSDIDFLKILIIENDKHVDLEPLEQAQGYQTLMKEADYDIPAIALKVSKSESYVYQRLKLLELIAEFQELLTDGKITAGHAILLARLQPDQQKELAKKESGLYEGWGPDRTVVSVRDLANYIERQIHLDLNLASFKKSDPDLVPEAGPCTTCRKRTGFVPALFPEIKKKDTCTDPSCFHKKVEIFTKQWIEKKSQDSDVPPLRLSTSYDGRTKKVPDDPEKAIPSQLYHEITDKKKDSCSSAREGIITDGRKEGRTLLVCVDPKCEKHHGRQRYSSPETEKWRAEQKAQEEKKKMAETVRLRIINEILRFLPSPKNKWELSQEDFAFLAGQLFDELWDEYQKKILARHDIKAAKVQYGFDKRSPMKKYIGTCSKADLCKLLMEMALIRNIESRQRSDKTDPLMETAKRYGVDPKKIEVELRAEAKTKEAEKKTKTKKSPSVKQKTKRADPPKAKTIPMKDLCKLHGPARKKDEVGKETAEIRIPVDQKFLALMDGSYSGDLLSNGGIKIREPFEWEGDFYTCLSGMSSGAQGIFWRETWKIVPADLFVGKTYTDDQLEAKWNKDEKERGNHNGRRVLLKNKKYILEGPRIVFYDPKLEKPKLTPGVCQECGCTETTPCEGGCAWTDKTKTLCAACKMAKEHL